MNKPRTLQEIWEMTDKSSIDLMTKSKRQSAATPNDINRSKVSCDSDSDCSSSSEGSFAAVPEEFRPCVPPNRNQKYSSTRVLKMQKDQASDPKNQKDVTHLPCDQRSKKAESNLPKQEKQVHFQDDSNKNRAQTYSPGNFKKQQDKRQSPRDETISRNACSENLPIPSNQIPNLSFSTQLKSTTENSNSITCTIVCTVPLNLNNATNEAEKHKSLQTTKNVRPIRKPRNNRVVNTKQGENDENANDFSLSKKQHCTPRSSSRTKKQENTLQYQCFVKKQGTIHADFDFPLHSNEKKSASKQFYETKFVQNSKQQGGKTLTNDEKSNSRAKTVQDHPPKKQLQVSFEENMIKWDSTLSLNTESHSTNNRIEWTVVRENKASTTKYKHTRNNHKSRKPSKQKLSECKSTDIEKVKQNAVSKSMQNEITISPQNNGQRANANHTKPKQLEHDIGRNESSLGNSFFRNNLSLDSNLNSDGAQCSDDLQTTRLLSKNEENVMNLFSNGEKCSPQKNYAGSENKELENRLQGNLQELLQEFGYSGNSIPQNPTRLQGNLQELVQEFSYSGNSIPQNPTRLPNRLQGNLGLGINHNQGSKPGNVDLAKEKEELKSIVDYGKDISDLIIGSHTALSMFISYQNEWKVTRHELIQHFEQLEKNLKESSAKVTRYRDLVNIANTGATFAAAIPHPYVQIAGRIISILSSLFSTFLNKPNSKEGVSDSNQITSCLFRDGQVSNELYMYGLQCNEQFDETTKLIEEFHSNARKFQITNSGNREIAKFIEGLLEYKPTHHIFFKKLHKCYQELLQTGTSSQAMTFCEPFQFHSTAVDVIGFLQWRFRCENFNSESVRHELQHLHQLIEDSNSISLKDLMKKIQNCIQILKDELRHVERATSDITLFDTPSTTASCKRKV